ncbi:Leucine-rich repeat family protein isoform 1 [Hibiscus syriacus]|uniref:Leucine-rich repeat family protein isoform 1 n=1 Tax=Hibiscus syriacus TaxID=106335 RepID=A0A6A3CBK6_HIBSY|nr:chemocyanin-like [Hibiscus syriacus]KAE8725997.1 Leucine-rich repeat family protein isoform 1 [Hibiscus syriacus]
MRMAIRGSSVLIPVMVFLMVFQLQYEAIHSYTPVHYMVGDEDGWDPVISMEGWAKGKDFHAGDVLEFVYGSGIDVSIVDQEAHDDCSVNDKSIEFSTGDDNITLAFGANYFICSRPIVCQAGLKLAINATAPPPSL